jgi:DNA-binding NtrC family response regulator
MMYPMDGHELARRAVALQPDLAIIIMTGLEADSLAGYAFPKNTCTLHKPFGVDALQAVIKAAMNVRDQATEIADVS